MTTLIGQTVPESSVAVALIAAVVSYLVGYLVTINNGQRSEKARETTHDSSHTVIHKRTQTTTILVLLVII